MMFRREYTKQEVQNQYPAIFAQSELESLSSKYLHIPTYKLLEGLEKAGFHTVGAKQSASRKENGEQFAKHVVYMATEKDAVMKHLVKGTHNRINEEIPMLALSNSHNGTSSFQIDTAFFRLVCSNGLMLPSSSISSARIVHKKGMEQDVINAAFSVVSNFGSQTAMIDAMKQIGLNEGERMLLAETATRLAFEDDVINLNKEVRNDIAPKLLRARRYADQASDLWTTFNVIQENIIKGGVRVVTENDKGQRNLRATRAVNSIDRDTKLNKELMTLAQEFMKLKGAAQ